MDESLKDYLIQNPNDIDGWLYYENSKLITGNNSDIVLNILSQALELNPNSEPLWLEYLNFYSNCKNLKDYNEICLLAIDNCSTYRVFWKVILNLK